MDLRLLASQSLSQGTRPPGQPEAQQNTFREGQLPSAPRKTLSTWFFWASLVFLVK